MGTRRVVGGVQTILGAGGAIGTELAESLQTRGNQCVWLVVIPLVRRDETVSADISNLGQTISAVTGSTIVHLVVVSNTILESGGAVASNQSNAIEACKRADARLIFRQRLHVRKVMDP
jgi:putative NADH-flavin reductase